MGSQYANGVQPEYKSYTHSTEECWVMTTKRAGDIVAGWQIDELLENSTRELTCSERCQVTSFCYPPGAKMIKAKLHRLTS